MRVAATENHLSLNEALVKDINKLAKKFSARDYSKISSVETILLKKDVSVEKKKKILARELHKNTAQTFSISKGLDKVPIEPMKQRLANLRKIIIKLRSINYYLETTFLKDLKLSKFKFEDKYKVMARQTDLARNELEVLEYSAYKMIEKAVSLDKRLLREYGHKAKEVTLKETSELNGIRIILRKESIVLEHLESKLPPPKLVTSSLMKEPQFTHWVSRIFALLLHFEWLYSKEALIFSKLKKNKLIRAKINKKISHLINERSGLVRIMHKKAESIRNLKIGDLKKELHNFTTTINL